MVGYSKKLLFNKLYYKVQRARTNIDYTTGTEIRHEALDFERDCEGELTQQVSYLGRTFASQINDRMRLTSQDKAVFKQPRYKYHVTTYEDVSVAEFDRRRSLAQAPDTLSVAGHSYAVVFFDLETGGFGHGDDILQISMKSGTRELNCYVDPTKPVGVRATEKNHLTARGNDLCLRGVRVASLPLELALLKVLAYLQSLDKRCILVGHNALLFDMKHFLRALEKYDYLDEFEDLVEGCADTLIIFKNSFPDLTAGYKLEDLARHFKVPFDRLHNAKQDVQVLESTTKAAFDDDLRKIGESYTNLRICLADFYRNERARELKPTYEPMRVANCLGKDMIRRLCRREISCDDIVRKFVKESEQAAEDLLRKELKSDASVEKIMKYLRETFERAPSRTSDSS